MSTIYDAFCEYDRAREKLNELTKEQAELSRQANQISDIILNILFEQGPIRHMDAVYILENGGITRMKIKNSFELRTPLKTAEEGDTDGNK